MDSNFFEFSTLIVNQGSESNFCTYDILTVVELRVLDVTTLLELRVDYTKKMKEDKEKRILENLREYDSRRE